MRRAVLTALVLLLALPSAAAAHAVLKSTVPERGATVDAAPGEVQFRFSEPVESAFGAVRVFDAEGERVDDGAVTRPAGDASVGVRLPGDLPDGTYTATYRVVSADSHPVSGGFVFQVGAGGVAPSKTVAELAVAASAGPVTRNAFRIDRGLEYAALAVVVGGLAFLLLVWLPALGRTAGGEDHWRAASRAFAARLRRLLIGGLVVGAVCAAIGIVLQGATAGGVSLWDAAKPDIIRDVLDTRFGTVWGLRLIDWLLIAATLAIAARLSSGAGALRPASVGATGLAPAAPSRAAIALLALPVLFLVASPGLAGHASVASPDWLAMLSDAVHVAAMSVWIGGLVMLVFALPAATRALPTTDRTRLLAAVLTRFSPLALASVIALLMTGALQSVIYLESFGDLTGTAFGRAILIKIGLIAVLTAFGAWNQRRALPALTKAAETGRTPGAIGVKLRRSLRTEIALFVVVLGVTSALVSYSPASGTTGNDGGPYAAEKTSGPVQAQVTVDPARVGRNTIHLYLFDAKSGAAFENTKELRASIRLPSRDIGPLELKTRRAGPGHYVVEGADVAVKGDWTLRLQSRVSEFDEYSFDFTVPIR